MLLGIDSSLLDEDFTLTWDLNGNMDTKSNDTTADDRTFAYNFDNKLQSATYYDDTTQTTKAMSVVYDSDSNRVSRTVDSVKTKFIVDTVGSLPTILIELPVDSGGTIGSLKKKYYYANAQILAQDVDDSQSGFDKYFYFHDRLGSVRMVIDDTATVKNHYTYNPFGEDITTECSYAGDTGYVENPWKFTGQWYDAEIAQYHLRARQYDPHTARFTGRDPVNGGFKEPMTLHAYLYCLNDPLNKVDPWGLLYTIPGAGDHYNEQQTQQVLDHAVDLIGKAYPLGALIELYYPRNNFDYKIDAPHMTFTKAGVKMSASEFGNYLAGYATFRNGGALFGELPNRLGGSLFGLTDFSDEYWGDDPGSKFFITAGALHSIRDKKKKSLKDRFNEIRLMSVLYDHAAMYAVSEVDGANNAFSIFSSFKGYNTGSYDLFMKK